ncbi:cupin domain-containing protein [Halobacteria archaeon AArc-m2/3/4]|uniref:Cupin domain-containing protein n=1 Tax=Natronoglomus mannanivorans TaxID=2979990 RepID=A0AAP2Z016_9EURY|nr:cupin domain-containing protein [Halobacteria archaeon AArc-xg1-1]MCU4975749.1 cupin domain-containing protein [Halobacteria archaeon AArc-m2/3/4]
MSYTKVNADDVEPVSDGLKFLRESLECDQLGLSVLDCEPGWEGMEHDHADDGEEEVYYLVEGSATVIVEGEEISMEPRDALRIAPDATRQIQNGETETTFVLAGAP